jgi:hypothetical protein
MVNVNRGDRVLPVTRWVALLIIPFLAAAFVILYLFPQQTARLFAWGIEPTMSAMMLAAAYAGGIYYFVAVLRARRWHHIKVGLPPVLTFSSLLGLATLLHWDRFTHNHISFFAWAGLYFTTPFIILAVWLRNRVEDPRQPETTVARLPQWARLVMGATGVITLLISLVLFLAPSLALPWWPWSLTLLTARVMGAMFAMTGVVGLGVASDERWSAARVILQSQIFSIVLILVAAARAWRDFNWSNVMCWLFVVGLAALLAGFSALFVFMDTRRRPLGGQGLGPALSS